MLTLTPYCFPCLAKLVQMTLEISGVKEEDSFRIIQKVNALAALNFLPGTVPAYLGTKIQRLILAEIGFDPYLKIKKADNQTAAQLVAKLDPAELTLQQLVQLAIGGNLIDTALSHEAVKMADLAENLREEIIYQDDFGKFAYILKQVKTILYLTDNCGEIVFDRLLLQRLNQLGKEIYLSPKSTPICNDATVEDILECGLDKYVTAIVAAPAAMGLDLEESSPEFLAKWQAVDLIIAKGMGNYEFLWGRPEKIVYLFRAKCLPVAQSAGVALHTNLMRLSPSCQKMF